MRKKIAAKFLLLGVVSLLLSSHACTKLFNAEETTTILLVRHAETIGSGSSRNLSEAGQARAVELSKTLKTTPIKAIFSTNFNRTMQTAAPIAEQKALTVQQYDPSNLSAFADDLIAEYKGETVLVVGHSNTTPSMLNILLGSNTYENLPETEYDNLFITTVVEKGNAKVILVKYGG